MHISEEGLKIIQAYEGLGDGNPATVNLEPYICPAKVYTVGWGYALKTPTGQNIDVDVFGKAKSAALAVEAMQRKFGKQAITRAEADQLLRAEIGAYEIGVEKAIGPNNATQAQFDALVSFTYNLGVGNFQSSAILRLHKANNRLIGNISMKAICAASKAKAQPTTMPIAFGRWSNANGAWMLGLFRRRLAEMMVYGGHSVAESLTLSRSFHD